MSLGSDDAPADILSLSVSQNGASPAWATDGVELLFGSSELLIRPAGRRRGLDRTRGPTLFIGAGLLSALEEPAWQSSGYVAFLRSLGSGAQRSVSLSMAIRTRALETLALIDEELTAREPGFETVAVGLLIGLLADAYRAAGPQDEGEDGPIPRLVAYIRTHYTDTLTLEDLADRCAMSPTHLSHRFRDEVGRPLFTFINEVRIDRACALLKRTSLSVVEIAYQVGYNSLSFFNRYFRRLTGLSPTEYRRKIGR